MESRAPEQSQKPNEAAEANRGGWITFPFIIVGVAGLSLAHSGALSNLIVYLIKEYNVKSIDAAQIGNIVSGSISVTPVAGAIVADAFFGCYPVVVFSTVVSFVSLVLFTLTAARRSLRPTPCGFGTDACESSSAGQLAVLYGAVALLALSAGGTRFNMLTMGANQFDKPQGQDVFFNWFFIALYSASIAGATAIVFVEDNISWMLGYGLCVIANAITVIAVLLGAKYYRRSPVRGSPFTGLARVAVAAIRKWNVKLPQANLNYYYGECENSKPATIGPTQSFGFLNRAAWIRHGETRPDGSIAKPWSLCTIRQVEDFKTILRIFPLWSSSIFLSVSIGIQLSLTVLQALTVDRSLGPHFTIPVGSIAVSSLAATVIFLSLLDRLVFPVWHRLTRHTPTPLRRIGLGHIINISAMAASAMVETKRAGVVHAHHAEGKAGWVVPMTVLWLVLPLVLAGVGEALHFPGQVALYYQEFPRSLQNTATGMIALTISLGFYLSTAVINLVRQATGWLPDNINSSKLANVYWLVTILTVVNFGYYVVCAMFYKYQNVPDDADGNDA